MTKTDLIPNQEEGAQSNTEAQVLCASEEEAATFFDTVRQRLLDVNRWHEYAGGGARFQLTDAGGYKVDRRAQEGDHFQIEIPAPGTITGSGADWVRIEAIEEQADITAIRVRPATNPTNELDDVAHFFDESATSSFIARREGCKVVAAVHGRNEKPNTKTEHLADSIRNIAVAVGAVTAFSKLQWKTLVEGLTRKEE